MTTIANVLTSALNANQLALSQHQQEQLIAYLDLIKTWNTVFNLTSITQPKEMVYLHLIDSLIIHPYLNGHRMLDVGTGAGLPGIPLAILRPEHHWTLLDKNSKKTRFLTQVAAELGLKNVEPVQARCEDFQPDQCFDTILSRAFASLSTFTSSTRHLLCKEGQWLAMKGKRPDDELADMDSTIQVDAMWPLHMTGMNVERHLIKLTSKY